MAIPSIPLALASANENTPASLVATIPTLFARLHAEIASCDDVEQLVEASVRIHQESWDISIWARCQLYGAVQQRCAGIRSARS